MSILDSLKKKYYDMMNPVSQGISGLANTQSGKVVSRFGNDLNRTLQNIGTGTGAALQAFVSQPLARVKEKNMMKSQNLASQAMQEKMRQQPVKKTFANDNEGWIRQGNFTPIKNISEKITATQPYKNLSTSLDILTNPSQSANRKLLIQGLQIPEPGRAPAAQKAVNFLTNVAAMQTGGIKDIRSGIEAFKNKEYLQSVVKPAFGIAKIATSGLPPSLVANVLSSNTKPIAFDKYDLTRRLSSGYLSGMSGENLGTNVADKNIKVLGSEFDPVKGVGSLVGFTKNPLWSTIFGKTQLINKFAPATKGVLQFIASRGVKGGVEGWIQALNDVPVNADNKTKADIFLKNIAFGAASEIVTDAGSIALKNLISKLTPQAKQELGNVITKSQKNNKRVKFVSPSGEVVYENQKPTIFEQGQYLNQQIEDNIPGAKQGFGNIAEPVGGNNAVMNADISKGLTPEVTTKVKIKPKIEPATVQEPIQLPVKNISPTEKLSLPQGDYTLKQPIGETTSKYNIGKNKTVNQRVLKQALDEVAPSFEKVAGSPITHEQIIKQAGEFSDEVVKTIGRQTTEQLGAAQLRLRQNIANMADSGQVTPELLEAMKTDASFARSTAQLLGQRAIDANPRTPYGKNMIKYVEEVNKVANDIDLVIEKAKGVDFNNPEQAATFYREFIKPTAGDWIDKIRFSSMLSSPNTVINNASSNLQGTGLLAPIEKTISGGIDAIVSGLTGSQRKYFAGEGVEYAKGYWSNMGKALQNFSDAMRGGSDAAEMYNVPLTKQGTSGRVAENTLSFFPRLAQATDELFKALTTGGLEKANAYKTAKGGVSQTADQIATEAKRRLFNQPFGSDQSYLLNALEFIPSKIMDATHSKNPFIKWTAKLAFPFIRIPTNVFKAGIEYSPLGVTTLPGANNKIEQASKALMGTTVALGAWQLANADRLTFGMPTSEKQRDAFTAAGMQPYSIKIGDKWISYTKFHPVVGFNMALASALKEQLDKKTLSDDQLDTVIGVAGKWLTYFANQSYVKQMGDFMSLQSGNETAIGKAIGNYPSQLIPFRALMGWIARAFDPNERKIDPDGSKIDKSLQSIMMSIPGIRNTLMPRTDSMGEPVKQQNRFLNLVSPAKITNEVPGEKQIYENLKQKSIQTSKENAIKAELKKSDNQVSELGANRYAIVDKISGNVNTIDLNPIEKPTVTGNAESDKKLFSNYNSKITSQITGVNKLLEANYIDQNKAEQLIAELQSQRPNKTKVTSSKKASTKKISFKSLKAPKLPKIKISKGKMPKIKLAKLKTKSYKFKPITIKRSRVVKLRKIA